MFRRVFSTTPVRASDPLMDSVQQAVKAKYSQTKSSFGMRLVKVFLPTLLGLTAYVGYNSYNSRPAFIPLLYTKSLPLARSKEAKGIDLDKLKANTKEILLSKLSMNHKIKNTLGLPLQLGEFLSFNVKIEYKNVFFEGLEIDCTKRWFPPEFRWSHREFAPKLKDDLNGLLEPMTSDGSFRLDSVENRYGSKRDYNMIVGGSIEAYSTFDLVSDDVDPGTAKITFAGTIQYDHIKSLKTDTIVLSYRSNGQTVVHQLL
ncbi:hypothetical protein KL911_002159 [Ogataea haglerorum]|uniref:uncharacterized protein n=1 Tax=Ogataea haglerorum TaxID=1937702 RepID=UPI001C8A016C|nr:uncharacterized protein KL911_002159 [Ogataea haglerorum]KAG7754720.1 hypothetical protein KL911_002159 [Ogataea haglerorum]